jgi:predicted DNA-binding transcriptional regulator AlpA
MSRGKHRVRPIVDGMLLSRKQAALRLNISLSLLDKFRRENRGPPEIRLGDAVRFRAERLDEWATRFEQLN